MDVDHGGTVDVNEICIVHESDKDAMMRILDADGNSQVDPAEWENYLYLKKQEKGKRKFGFFLNYLEQEVPKNMDKLVEAKKGGGVSAAVTEAPAEAPANTSAPSQSEAPRS